MFRKKQHLDVKKSNGRGQKTYGREENIKYIQYPRTRPQGSGKPTNIMRSRENIKVSKVEKFNRETDTVPGNAENNQQGRYISLRIRKQEACLWKSQEFHVKNVQMKKDNRDPTNKRKLDSKNRIKIVKTKNQTTMQW